MEDQDFALLSDLYPAKQDLTVLLAQCAEVTIVREDLFVLSPPREGRAVHRILIALQSDLVSIIDRGHAGEQELQKRCDLQPTFRERISLLAESQIPPLLLGRGAHVHRRERIDRAHGVVGADQGHRGLQYLRGIILTDAHDLGAEGSRPTVQAEGKDRLLEGVIHHAVQFALREVGTEGAVTDLHARVLPDLADHDRPLVRPLDRGAEIVHEIGREFVHDVETPSVYPEMRPLIHDAPLSEDEIAVACGALIESRHDLAPPPTVVFVGEIGEMIPVEIGRFGALIGAEGVVMSELIEIDAVRTRMIEDAVENDADPSLPRLRDQRAEVLLRPDERVDAEIVPGIVAMIGTRLKNRREIDLGRAE